MRKDSLLQVFIAHSSRDRAVARELYQSLKSEAWIEVWFVESSLKVSQDWDSEIRSAVKRADVIILIRSRYSSRRESYFYPDPNFIAEIYNSKPQKKTLIVTLRADRSVNLADLDPEHVIDYFPNSRRTAVNLELREKLKKVGEQKGFKTKRDGYEYERGEGLVWSAARSRELLFIPDEEKVEESESRVSRANRSPSIWRRRISNGLTRAMYFFLTSLVLFAALAIGLTVNFVNTGETVNDVAAPVVARVLTLAPLPTPTLGIGNKRISPVDRMWMVYVPAGEFIMGSDEHEDDEKPAHRVSLDAYWIDQHEVTNTMYANCVEAGMCGVPMPHQFFSVRYEDFHRAFFDELAENPAFGSQPVTSMFWENADAYCRWAGRRLPTEAEWEKAARGIDGRTYPWGEAVDCTRANFFSCLGNPAHVGSFEMGVSPYGAYDMAGNAMEWVADWYGRTYYEVSPTRNPLGPATGNYRVFRGGGWGNDSSALRTTNRPGYFAYLPIGYIGFRCAISGDAPVVSTATTPERGIVTQISAVDRMSMAYVPAREFIMGSGYFEEDEKPVGKIHLDAYWIDQYEVTNGQYARCVEDEKCQPPYAVYFVSGNQNHYFDPVYVNHPVTGVSWNDAIAYCAWAGRRLPTEAEWEKAARGENGMKYPWGEKKPSERLLNFDNNVGGTTPVGSYAEGVSPYGVYDMAGNVWEWVNDWYDDTYYRRSPFENPSGPEEGNLKILRGGSWGNDAETVRATNRYAPYAFQNLPLYIGFRCAFSE